jgi:type IV pilus assembly protein PilM
VFEFLNVRSRPLVGIDISSSAIKMLALSRTDGQYRVEAYRVQLLPPLSVVDRSLSAIDKVAETIRQVIESSKINSKYVALGVSGGAVITRVVQLNARYQAVQLAEQIEAEAERYFPFPLDELYYDFEVVGPFERNPEFSDVLLAAARVEAVDNRVTAVTEAGLKAVVVEIESMAVERAFAMVVNHLPAQGKDNHFALVDIGATITSIYIFRGLKVIYSREQVFGGKHLTDEIKRRYGLSAEEAMIAQNYGGLPEDYAAEVLTPFKETVIQQIARALQIFSSSSEDIDIHYVVLAGGVSKLPGLETLVQSQLKIKSFVANPFIGAQIAEGINKEGLHEEAPGLLVACGLALRNFDDE